MKVEKKYLSAPLTAQLEVTDLCNHRCVHCYNLDSHVENRPVRKVDDESVLACARKLIEGGIFSVVVTGGEPLIKKGLTERVIRLFRDNGVRVTLNSNLTLFDDEFVEFLSGTKVGVLTSCPSGEASSFEKLVGVDNYEVFERNVKKLLAAGVGFSVNMVVTKENLHEVRTTAGRMKELGCRSFAATPMGLNMDYPRLDLLLSAEEVREVIADLLWVERELGLRVDILEALPKCVFPDDVLAGQHSFLNRKCQAGRTVIAVSCNGDVRPCAHNPMSYGNILEEGLRSVWARMEEWRSMRYVPAACRECAWLDRCNGGCRTSAKTIGGEWDSKDMWAAEPLRTPPPKGGTTIELLSDTRLRVNGGYRIRREEEDAYVVYNIEADVYFMVNGAYRGFIDGLKSGETFGFGELAARYGVTVGDRAFYDAVLFLVRKNILRIV